MVLGPARRALPIGLVLLAAVPAAAQNSDPFLSAPAPVTAPAPRPAPRPPPPRQAEPEPTVVAPQPAPAPATSPASYDGNYVGEVKFVPGNSETGNPANGFALKCSPGSVGQSIEIRNGQFSFVFDRTGNTTVTGKVGGDGTLDGLGNSYYGGARVTGHIQNNELVGSAWSSFCKFELRLQKR